MARENFLYLHGQVYDKPRIYLDGSGVARKASFGIKIMRRPINRGKGTQTLGGSSIDVPIVMTMDEELIKTCAKLHKGDMVDIRGVLTTREVRKKTICPNGHEHIWAGNIVFVTPIYICQRETELSDDEGNRLLHERSEISNIATLIGTLCRNPVLNEFVASNGKTNKVCQYQIAVNRRYHIRDGQHDDERTDYPWVKTSGKQALDDNEHLQTGSVIFIDGAIQTREIERTITCGTCGEQFKIKEAVTEIYPYAVEYLSNCLFPEDEKQEPAAAAVAD